MISIVFLALVARLSVKSIYQFEELSFHGSFKQKRESLCTLASLAWRQLGATNRLTRELTTSQMLQ